MQSEVRGKKREQEESKEDGTTVQPTADEIEKKIKESNRKAEEKKPSWETIARDMQKKIILFKRGNQSQIKD